MPYIDLHIHSSFSDGKKTSEEIISLCKQADVRFASITDHDDMRSAGICNESVRFINGIELSAYYGDAEIHLLGYGYRADEPALIATMAALRQERIARFQRMIAKAIRLKLIQDVDYSDYLVNEAVIGRVLMSELLIKTGCVRSVAEAFARFLSEGKPLYEPVYTLDLFKALELLKNAGCFVSLAHPQRIRKDELIRKLVDRGLDAIEAYYPFHDATITRYYLKLAEKYTIIATGGSDYHTGNYSCVYSCDQLNAAIERLFGSCI